MNAAQDFADRLLWIISPLELRREVFPIEQLARFLLPVQCHNISVLRLLVGSLCPE